MFFFKLVLTNNALNWGDSTQHCFKDVNHCSVLQYGLLKHCQSVLREGNHNNRDNYIFQQRHNTKDSFKNKVFTLSPSLRPS